MSFKRRIETHVDDWNKLLLELSKDLKNDDLMDLAFLAKDRIGNADYHKLINNPAARPTELFDLLIEKKVISENDVDYLKKILKEAKLISLIQYIDEYERENDKIKRRKIAFSKRHGENEFIGRQKEIDQIIGWLGLYGEDANSSDCVFITGPPGTGKTELAYEVCARMEAKNVYFIELKGINKSIDAFLKLFNEVLDPENAIKLEDYNSAILQSRVKEFCQFDEKYIILDNVDDIIAPDNSGSYKNQKEPFIEDLKCLVNIPIDHGRIKFIVTSRFRVFKSKLPRNFYEICVSNFTESESVSFLCKYSNIGLKSSTAERIASCCQNNPLALKIVANRLRTSNIRPQEIVDLLEKYKMEVLGTGAEDSGIQNALLLVFNKLDITQKVELASLTLFAGSFNYKTAAKVLSINDLSRAKLHIQTLLNWNLIEKEVRIDFANLGVKMEDNTIERYTIHLLVKTFLQDSGPTLLGEKVFNEAGKAFVENYGRELQSEARKSLRHNYSEGKFFLEKEKANLLEYFKLSKKLNIVPPVKHRKDQDRLLSLFTFMMDTLMHWEDRAEYFRNMAETAERSADLLSYCFFKAMQAEQYIYVKNFQPIPSIISKPFEIIEKLVKEKGSTGEKLVQAELDYVKGQLLAETEKFPRGCDLLKKSLDTKMALYGTSTFTLRSLRALGSVYRVKGRKLDTALEYFNQAYKMIDEINKDLFHPEFPALLMEIGNCHLEKGYELTNKKLATDQYNKAACCFERAIVSEKKMKVYSYTALTAKILRSKALAHLELCEYDAALEDATNAMHIRRTKCGFGHSDTAEITFLVGHIYYERGVNLEESKEAGEDSEELFKKALLYLKDAFNIEKNLGCHSHTNVYERLKKVLCNTLKKLHMEDKIKDYQKEFEIAESLQVEDERVSALEKMEVECNTSPSTSASEDDSDVMKS